MSAVMSESRLVWRTCMTRLVATRVIQDLSYPHVTTAMSRFGLVYHVPRSIDKTYHDHGTIDKLPHRMVWSPSAPGPETTKIPYYISTGPRRAHCAKADMGMPRQ